MILPICLGVLLTPFVNVILSLVIFVMTVKEDSGEHDDFWEGTWLLSLGTGLAWCFGFQKDLENAMKKKDEKN